MGLTLGQVSAGIESRIDADDNEISIREGWSRFEGKMEELRSRGRFDAANRHPEALQKIEQGVGIRFESLAQAEEAIRIQRQLADQNFNGDARAAIDFIIQQGRNPEFAGLPFSLQTLQRGLPSNPRATSNMALPVEHSREPDVSNPSPQFEDAPQVSEQSGTLGRFQVQRDQRGRLDLNGDGVGGLQGLIKAITDKLEGFSAAGNGNLSNQLEVGRIDESKWQSDMSGRPMVGTPYDPSINTLR